MSDRAVKLRGQVLHLLPQKAVWWPERKTLLVADVHLGKVETFQRYGIGLPSGSTQHDLARLSVLIEKHLPERLMILGDWLHAREAQNPLVHEQIQTWREKHHTLSILLIRGNHDWRAGIVPEAWRMDMAEVVEDAPFVYTHAPQAHESGYVLCGHLHPAVHLTGHGKQRIKHPCFWIRPEYMVFPSFGSFTGSSVIDNESSDRVYIPLTDSVIPLKI